MSMAKGPIAERRPRMRAMRKKEAVIMVIFHEKRSESIGWSLRIALGVQ
jgi:hypothetical protein